MIEGLLDRRVVFVGGKGGVGKTTTASALSVLAARRGKRVLLVSTDPAHSLGDLFDQRIGSRETCLAENLVGLEIDPEAEADRHIETVTSNMRNLVAPAMFSEIKRQMDLARLAPGTAEAALLERVAELMVEARERFDLVVFDTAPTGHTLRLLTLPEAMTAWTDGLLKHRERSGKLGEVLSRLGGARRSTGGDELAYVGEPEAAGDSREDRIRTVLLERRRKFHRARRLLLDRTACGFMWVLIPERLPILETRKALDMLEMFDIHVEGTVVNRTLPAEADGEFLARRRSQERSHLAEIEEQFTNMPRLYLPLLAEDITDREALGRLVDLMANGGE